MKKILALLFCLLLLPSMVQAEVYWEQDTPADWDQRPLFRITVFRTGESDCHLLECGGESMLIDGGAKKWRDPLWEALTERGISRVKYLFNTHPHDDHVNGLYFMMNYGLRADAYLSIFPPDYKDDLHQRAVKEAAASGIPYHQLSYGETLTLGDATLTVYNWDKGYTINARSAITRVEYGECSALLCADIIGKAQSYFLETLPPEVLKADVTKAPHHGITPFVPEFLTAVDPKFVWITNYDEKRLSKIWHQIDGRSIPFAFSGEGTIILETDGTDWYVHQELGMF